MNFKELNLSREVLNALDDMGFNEPSKVQEESIPYALEGRDILVEAQTGTGKTASFGIPMIEKLEKSDHIKGLVLVPTRELARQVSDELKKIAKYKKFIKILPIYGGADMGRQFRELRNGVDIVVGTPGRVMDHMRRKTILLDNLEILVLDEADEMFDMGFRDDMKTIIEKTNPNRITSFYSATLGNDIKQFSKLYQNNPEKIVIEKKELTQERINQYYLEMNNNMKSEILNRLIMIYKPKKSIIFCNTKRMVEKLETELAKKGYKVDSLHGDMRQGSRDSVMKKFRENSIDILIATDIAARGLDVDDIDVVFNYDFPQQNEYYVHRIGRTARAGKNGISFTFLTSKDFHKLAEIEKYTNANMEKISLPTLDDVKDSNEEHLFEMIKENISKENSEQYVNLLNRLLAEGNSLYDIAASLIELLDNANISENFSELKNVDYGKKLSIKKNNSKKREERREKKRDKKEKKRNYPEIFINKGKRDGLDNNEIIRLIRKYTNLSAKDIGKISLMPSFTFVEIPENKIVDAAGDLDGRKVKGKTIKVELASK
ncbi:DEAD/DEAH box helicase [Peptoniphilus sp. MSJ-1]|uniref:DEAD/DEAH box helicase n=1 Tax=Peptoniphilus ovalis TaxID=2841503 RepID=A0ABS6FE70_9FIRM|nr:DEAD/DEAH box helicase [Peptoniphilus ovalis]MBU5668480.1 DEAD/DEAH box helicase [Peptoniphilus ovalis]